MRGASLDLDVRCHYAIRCVNSLPLRSVEVRRAGSSAGLQTFQVTEHYMILTTQDIDGQGKIHFNSTLLTQRPAGFLIGRCLVIRRLLWWTQVDTQIADHLCDFRFRYVGKQVGDEVLLSALPEHHAVNR